MIQPLIGMLWHEFNNMFCTWFKNANKQISISENQYDKYIKLSASSWW